MTYIRQPAHRLIATVGGGAKDLAFRCGSDESLLGAKKPPT
jgi:hypothetical protein